MVASVFSSGLGREGFPVEATEILRKTVFDTTEILFVASTPDDFARIDPYTERVFQFSHDIGLFLQKYRVLDMRMSDNRQKEAVSEAPCVFLQGGYAGVQLAYLRKQGLLPLLQAHAGVIVGLSAGRHYHCSAF